MDRERGRALKDLREASGLLQRHVGAEFDIDKAAVSSWESGRTRPDVARIRRLDEMYGGTGAVLELFDLRPPDEPDEPRRDERRLLLVLAAAVGALLDAAVADGEEDLAEMLDELRSAMRDAQ